jgi:SynChlorMet cassette radical SAM/SPASM protein ScmE
MSPPAALPQPVPPRLWQTPKTVEVALTGACNLTCGYCSYNATRGPRHADDLATEQLLALFDELGELGVMKVILTGGEPLLRPDLLQLVGAVVKNRMRFSINSNGVLMTPDLAAALKATRRLDKVQISIDGAEDWSNDKNRGRGAFAGALRGLTILRDLDVPRGVRLTITRFTADHLEAALEMLLGVAPEVGTNELMPFGRGESAYHKMAISDGQRAHVTEVLTRLAAKYPGRIQASAGPLASARERARYAELSDAGCASGDNGAGHFSSCGGFHEMLAILHDGAIVPCIQIPSVRLGKVGEVAIGELWLTHQTLHEFRNRWEVKLESVEYCRGCKYIPFCHGGCPANAVASFGTHLAPDPIHCMRRLIDGIEFERDRVVHRGGGAVHLRTI